MGGGPSRSLSSFSSLFGFRMTLIYACIRSSSIHVFSGMHIFHQQGIYCELHASVGDPFYIIKSGNIFPLVVTVATMVTCFVSIVDACTWIVSVPLVSSVLLAWKE